MVAVAPAVAVTHVCVRDTCCPPTHPPTHIHSQLHNLKKSTSNLLSAHTRSQPELTISNSISNLLPRHSGKLNLDLFESHSLLPTLFPKRLSNSIHPHFQHLSTDQYFFLNLSAPISPSDQPNSFKKSEIWAEESEKKSFDCLYHFTIFFQRRPGVGARQSEGESERESEEIRD